MSAGDVWFVLDLIIDAGMEVWVDGGWGVDALLGTQTRDHDDLDIVVRTVDLIAVRSLLEEHRFELVRDDGPFNPVLGDPDGRLVDLHSFDHSSIFIDPKGVERYGANGLAYEAGAFGASGVIAGRPVACCTAAHQMRSHTGYPLDEDDWGDLRALGQRFGLTLPGEG